METHYSGLHAMAPALGSGANCEEVLPEDARDLDPVRRSGLSDMIIMQCSVTDDISYSQPRQHVQTNKDSAKKSSINN